MNKEAKTELEIERRFLLKSLPAIDNWDSIIEMEQFYLTPKGAETTERVRACYYFDNGDNLLKEEWIHTTKVPTDGLGQEETEYNITEKEFDTFRHKADRSIKKARHIMKVDSGLKWEVDVFEDFDLVIAEIEIPTEDFELTIPVSIHFNKIMEITGIKQFSNSNLAE
jgi:CYTH domain-containing protein